MKFPTEYEVKSPVWGLRAFRVPNPIRKRNELCVLATKEPNGWEHISVSLPNRNPSWKEMCYIKDLFFDEEDCCIQFHPKKSQYVNVHKHCLHIWKPPADIVELLEK